MRLPDPNILRFESLPEAITTYRLVDNHFRPPEEDLSPEAVYIPREEHTLVFHLRKMIRKAIAEDRQSMALFVKTEELETILQVLKDSADSARTHDEAQAAHILNNSQELEIAA